MLTTIYPNLAVQVSPIRYQDALTFDTTPAGCHEWAIAVGGFSGNDNALTVEQLKQYVASGQLRYAVVGNLGGPIAGGPGAGTGDTIVGRVHLDNRARDGRRRCCRRFGVRPRGSVRRLGR